MQDAKLGGEHGQSGKINAEEPYGNKGKRSGLAADSKNKVSHCTRLPRMNKEDLGAKYTNPDTSEERGAVHGPRALPGSQSTIEENWNLIAVTKHVRRDDEGRVELRGPRNLPTAHCAIREDWNLMTVTNPARRGNERRLRLRRPNPFPPPNPAVNSFGAQQSKAFHLAPLIRQEVSLHPDLAAQEAEQSTRPDQIPLRPISYKPILLTGRHPLHRPLPPIPAETDPQQDVDCQPPPVPPHVVLYRRKDIAMHAHDDFDSPTERFTWAPEAPVGTYLGRETLYSGWQPARCDTVCSSFTE